jgi:hypothetical protein
MSWSPAMRESRRSGGGQADMLDAPILAYKLVCNGLDPLTNRFVTTRAPHGCAICEETIGAGERVRRETRRSADGKSIETRHVCQACAKAILAWEAGDWSAINSRHAKVPA